MQDINLKELKEQLHDLKTIARILDQLVYVLAQEIDAMIEKCMDVEDNNAI